MADEVTTAQLLPSEEAESLIAAYEDEPITEAANLPSETPAATVASNAAERSLPPRDEATGQFVKPPETFSHPRWLVDQASDLGYTQEDLDTTPTDQLGREISRLHKQLRQNTRQDDRAQTVETARGSVEPLPPEPEKDELDFGGVKDDEGSPFTEKHLHPGIAAILKAQAKQLKDLKADLEAVKGYTQSKINEENLTIAERIDNTFAKFNDPRLGKGSVDQLKPNSTELMFRRAILAKASEMAGERSSKEAKLGKLEEAYKSLFGSSPPKAEEPAAPSAPAGTSRITKEQWKNGAVNRPTQRKGAPEPRGVSKAEKAVAEKMREEGLSGEGGEDVNLDEFPE